MIKTISVLEAKFLKRILSNYYHHLSANRETLISRIFGFHMMKIFKTKTDLQKVYLIVIVNVFRAGLEVDFRYDIKGEEVKYIQRICRLPVWSENSESRPKC